MTLTLVFAAITCLLGDFLDIRALIYIGKPLATIAVIMIAWRSRAPVSASYRALITAGLLWSLAGDVFLMLPGDRFIAGLASFLVAHLLYIAAFARDGGNRGDLRSAAVYLFGGAMLALLWPTLGALRLPVTVYVAVIATMAWQALARAQRRQTPDARLAAIGAVFFLLSDSALAWGRFRGALPASALIVLGSYWLAQWCIARSVTASATVS